MKWYPSDDLLISDRNLSARELAEMLGISPHAVYQRRSKLGIQFWAYKKNTAVTQGKIQSKWPRSYKLTRRFVLERDKWTCFYCGGEADQVDHVIPKNHGGLDLPNNLVASCRRCNNAKGSSCVECPRWKAALGNKDDKC